MKYKNYPDQLGFSGSSAGKESACNEGDLGSILGLGRSFGEVNGYPLQYSGLQNSMDMQSMGLQRVGHESSFHFTSLPDQLGKKKINKRHPIWIGRSKTMTICK